MTGFCIPYEASNFPPGFPAAGEWPCSWPALLRAAVSLAGSTPGAGSAVAAWLPGASLEYAWRIALMGANLRQVRPRGSARARALRQTDQYRALDPSEKGAVSFFLGQVSAKFFAEHLLGASVFARVDESMQVAGLPLKGRRPDFHGWSPALGEVFAIEAKGRSGLWNNHTMLQAKKQACLLPPVLGGGLHTAVAHMAYFERREWKAWMLDPPPQRQRGTGPSLEAVLFAYYRPFARLFAERDSGEVAVVADVEYDVASLPEVDVRIGLRRDLRAALAQDGLTDEGRGTKLRLSLAGVEPGIGLLSEPQQARQALVEQSQSARERALGLAVLETMARQSVGTDGVFLQVGPSWDDDIMSIEPEQRVAALR